ncbi:MAG TPA: hypothetical protein VHH73_16830, partial [Verrucomicrobiae bacterium]|nr:hypothetical protein [Verrucomicrobiae bacterium]
MNPPVHHQQKHRVQQLSLWLLVALAGISLHWLASSSESLLEAKFGEETPRSSGSGTNHSGATISTPPATRESAVDQTATRRFLVFAAVVFIGASVLIYRHRAALIGPRLRHFDLARTQPRHVLVLFVSPEDHIDGKTRLVEGTEDSAGQWTLDSQPYLTQAELAVASVPAARVKLAINQVPKGVRWPWQQTLRAIEPHLRHDTLREIWLLGSSGKHGSYRELDRLEKLLGAVLGKSVEIRRDGRDFVPANQKADYAGCDFEE